MAHPRLPLACLGALGICGFAIAQDTGTSSKPTAKNVTLQQLKGRCRIEIDGKLFTEYVYEGWPNPILYPIHGAGGLSITRNFPMRNGKDEARDHRHHRSLWFAHGDVNGHDFWSGKGRIVHERLRAGQGKNIATIIAKNRWVVGDDIICRETRTIAFHAQSEGRFIDYAIELHASEGDVVFGDTKEGTMALRLAPTLRLRGKVAQGELRNSEGITGKKAWGKRAKWVDYHGPVDGKVVGVAIFDHPGNHGHPCRWHARDYGLVAANPWGIAQFEGKPKGTGDMTLAKGRRITLRYRFYFHAGDTEQAAVAEQYEKFAKPSLAKKATSRKSK